MWKSITDKQLGKECFNPDRILPLSSLDTGSSVGLSILRASELLKLTCT